MLHKVVQAARHAAFPPEPHDARTPAQIMGLNKGLLQPGFDGDVVLVAPEEE